MMRDTTDHSSIKVIIQSCKDTQCQIAQASVMIIQIVSLFKQDTAFVWNFFYGIGALHLLRPDYTPYTENQAD